jgi:hypothetical protein
VAAGAYDAELPEAWFFMKASKSKGADDDDDAGVGVGVAELYEDSVVLDGAEACFIIASIISCALCDAAAGVGVAVAENGFSAGAATAPAMNSSP